MPEPWMCPLPPDEKCPHAEERDRLLEKLGYIYEETGIDNPETIVKLLNEWLQIKQWVQTPLTPDHLYLNLKDMFKIKT